MFSIPQMVLVILWFTFYNLLTSGTGLGLVAGGVVLNGLVVGAIMGDISTGFYLGGTYELMNIGLNPLGAVAGVETGMAVGIVVATLASTLDVLAKMVGSFFLHKAQDEVKKKNIKGAMSWIRLGLWPRILLDATLPLIILFVFGAPLVEAINNVIPAWLLTGFKTAGNMLPAIGFAILLRSMNIKGNFQYVIIGFVLFAYFGIGALGAALVGVALAMIAYQNNVRIAEAQNMGGVGDE